MRRKILELQDRVFELEYAVASLSKALNQYVDGMDEANSRRNKP